MSKSSRSSIAVIIWCSMFCNLGVAEEPESPDVSGQPISAPVYIEVATVGASEATDYLIEEIEAFNRHSTSIQVRYYAIGRPRRPEEPLNTLTHLGSNIIGFDTGAGTEVYYLVSRNLLVPIDRFLPDPAFPDNVCFDNLWELVTLQGKRWGVPFLCNAYVLFCDWSLFAANGIDEPPSTWDEYFKLAQDLTMDSDGNGTIDQYGGNIGFPSRFDVPKTYLWETMVLQKGGHFIKDGHFDLTHPALREAYEFIENMARSGAVKDVPNNFGTMIRDPEIRYAMYIQPAYRLKELKDRTNFVLSHLPTFGRKVSLAEKCLYLAIARSTPEKEAASWEFLKWLNRPDFPVARTLPSRFTFPCRADLLSRQEVTDQFRDYPRNSELVHLAKSWPVQWFNVEADTPAAKIRFESIIADLFADKLSFDEAMDMAESECNAILARGDGEVHPYALYR